MPIIVINSPGTTLGTETHHFTLRAKGRKIGRIPPAMIDSLVISGGVEITRKALSRLGRAGIPATILGREGRVDCRLVPAWGTDPLPRMGQTRLHDNAEAKLGVARTLIAAKTANQIAILNQWLSNHRDPEVTQVRDRLLARRPAIDAAPDIDSLRGHEGHCASLYFPAWGRTLSAKWTAFVNRNRRPPRDPVNALLSYCYAILANRLQSFLEAGGLDPYIATLHSVEPRRASLALDLLEPFRPALGDRFVRRILNLGQLRQEHFDEITFPAPAVLLNADGRRAFMEAFSSWLCECDPDNVTGMHSADQLLVRTVEAYRDAMRKGPENFRPYLLPDAPAP